MEQEQIKKYVSVAFGVSAVLVAFAVWNYSDAFSKSIQPSSFRSFSVSAEGKSVSIPDVATFTFSVVTQGGKDLAKIQTDNTDKMNKAIAFVKAAVWKIRISRHRIIRCSRYQYNACPRDGAVCPPPENCGV